MSSENSRTILFLLEDPSLFFNVNELAKQSRITYYFSWLSDTPSAIDAIKGSGLLLTFVVNTRVVMASNNKMIHRVWGRAAINH